ncbi:MAG: type II toxin-antitoxin system HicA family toxin [Leptolyngbya sp.]|uniref:Type II toxin-antitoxin system HicA family toxin n=1 Tax=Shackletoniella antarctica TaxID=268115 RepID=A0A2W4WBL5_9CYAN|nr:MAG: type II toxin-antitoxin system HicA family toxin [Shackletoniella antarctica]PZV10700.1 MAG: type II toxin-antitoxin system HicA family toxin [Leptolyngbya sp.]
MPRLKRLSGAEVVTILEHFGFRVYSQRGSHIKLRRDSDVGKEILTVPNHRQLDTGTCRAIYRQACRYIPESELFAYFYQ